MVTPVIYDHAGRPIRLATKDLSSEHATPTVTGVRSVFSDPVASGLTPGGLAKILRNAVEDDSHDYFVLAEEIEEREPHYRSVLSTRKLAASGIDPIVDAASDDAADQEIADAVRLIVEHPAFTECLEDALDALGKGVSAVEIIWDTTSTRWTPAEFIWRDPRFFQFDKLTKRQLRLKVDGNEDGRELPPAKYIIHRPKLKSGLDIRCGLARIAAWSYMLKSYVLKDWAAFCEVFGMPLRIGKYPRNATEETKRKILRAVHAIAGDAAVIIPEDATIDFITTQMGRGEAVFGKFAEFIDAQVSKVVLGQTMTSDDGSSLAQAQVHDQVRMDIMAADARRLAATINRDVIRPFVEINFGRRDRYPLFKLPVEEPEDLDLMTKMLERLVPLGLKVQMSDVRDKLGFADPDDDAELLTAPAGPKTEAPEDESEKAENRRALNRAENDDPGNAEMDAIGAEALGDWQRQADPLLDPIRRLAERSNSFEEFIGGLNQVGEEMDETALGDALAKATMKARGYGSENG